jgi:hypothetical protein
MATAKKKSSKSSTKTEDKVVKKKAPAKKTVKKKAAPKKAASKKAAAKKSVKKAATKKSGRIHVTLEQRHKMICEAAYYISLTKTHETVNPYEDWLQAEAAIDQICTIHDE